LIMLALDAKITFDKTEKEIPIGNFLPRPTDYLPGKLITKIKFPANVKLAFDLVSRTPADKPIVCAALAQWPSGRTRLALGGYGPAPLLALDGTRTDEMAIAARNAFHDAADEWASAGYRMDMGAILTKRCIENI
jgi:CO/xanthine dehydrogenase FAD-binding subunit